MHQASAFRLALMITCSRPEAEDAVQEAFIRAYRALRRFRAGASFKPWLLAIAANEAKTRRRRAAHQTALTARLAETPLSGDAVPSPETVYLTFEQRQRLLNAVEALDENDRVVITCRYLLHLSERETASIAECRLGTVKSRTSRALERLKRQLGADHV